MIRPVFMPARAILTSKTFSWLGDFRDITRAVGQAPDYFSVMLPGTIIDKDLTVTFNPAPIETAGTFLYRVFQDYIELVVHTSHHLLKRSLVTNCRTCSHGRRQPGNQCGPLSLVEIQRGSALIGRELHSVAPPVSLMP